ncbi:hypothetical protein [Methylocella sp.]|uniref:hypothetical protein n=1 Tax=Methylocella sp. TaxID=1978226 RepID=UPI0035B07711
MAPKEVTKRRGAPRRLSLGFDDWNAADQAFYAAAFPADNTLQLARLRRDALQQRGIVSPRGSFATLSSKTMKNRLAALERILGFLQRKHPEAMHRAFADRFDAALVRDFVADFSAGTKPQSIADILDRARAALEIMAPRVDFSHMKELARAIPNRSPRSQKPPPLIPAMAVLDVALDELDRQKYVIDTNPNAPDRRKVLRACRAYRNSLIVALLVADPLRLKNILNLTLHTSLRIIAGVGFEIVIPPHEMKTRRKGHRRKLPPSLNDYVQFYVDVVRPRIAGQRIVDEPLWVTASGDRMSAIRFHQVVTETTTRLVGARLTTHDFRKLVSDLVAQLGLPQSVAKANLDHAERSGLIDRVYTRARRSEGRKLLAHVTRMELNSLDEEGSPAAVEKGRYS